MNNIELLDKRIASIFYGRFKSLRPAQEAAIEPLINSRNLVLSSGTGSGKTEAVMAPLLSLYWKQAITQDTLTILYIAPTKALVNDLAKRLAFLLNQLKLKVGIRHGDKDDLIIAQISHVLITTPESLEVLLFRNELKISNTRALVIDEVHLLYNTQRGLQLSILIQRLKKLTNQPIQWAALSATVAKLSDIRDFLFGSSEQADFVELSTHRPINAVIRQIPDKKNFEQLISLLKGKKLLLFANSRKVCEELVEILKQNQSFNSNIFAHYSSLSPEVRVETENSFSMAKSAICISTSTLELGIDIGDIDAVILWGVPGGIESFLQRIGRSNRRDNKTNVICLIPDDENLDVIIESLKFIALITNAQQGIIPMKMPYELFGAVAQQCLSVIGSTSGKFTRISDLYNLFNNHNYLNIDILEKILSELDSKSYLKKHGFKNQYGGNENLYKLIEHKMIYGNFAISSKRLEIRYSRKVLGEIPVDNLIKLDIGNVIRFAGNTWRICKLHSKYIEVEPTQQKGITTSLQYSGEKIQLDPFLFNSIWKIIFDDYSYNELLSSSLFSLIDKYKKQFQEKCKLNNIPYVRTFDGFSYFTFAGQLVNKAIASFIREPEAKFNDIYLKTNKIINWKEIPTHPKDYESIFYLLIEEDKNQSIYQKLLPKDLQSKEFLQNWLKDQSIFDILNRLSSSQPIEIDINLI